MNWVFLEKGGRSLYSPMEEPYFLSHAPPAPPRSLQSQGFNLNSKVSPSMLLIIVILAVIFFVSGLLHLLVRFLMRAPYRDPEEADNVTALQGQLQQLFHLHDAGVDQSFIDTLPVFHYKAIIGSKTPFDCAVCLCEFEPEDKLRLLPKCSHAFHMECIDTWLLSHSTCPLCRASLLPDFSPNPSCSPFVFVLESGSESSREIVTDRETVLRTNSHLGRTSSVLRTSSHLGRTSSVLRTSSHLGLHGDSEFGSSRIEIWHKSSEIAARDGPAPEEKVVHVKLGKFRGVDGLGEGSSSKNVDERRCFSMGSFQYVMDENSILQVPIRSPMKKQSSKKPLMPGHNKAAMSECDCESRREFNGFEANKIVEAQDGASISSSHGSAIGRSKKESFSISKIWLRGKKADMNSSRRACSFRFPVQSSAIAADDSKAKNTRRTISEMEIGRFENGGRSELGCDVESQSCNSLDSQPNPPSFARKTLLWLVGRQNKVVHSSNLDG